MALRPSAAVTPTAKLPVAVSEPEGFEPTHRRGDVWLVHAGLHPQWRDLAAELEHRDVESPRVQVLPMRIARTFWLHSGLIAFVLAYFWAARVVAGSLPSMREIDALKEAT